MYFKIKIHIHSSILPGRQHYIQLRNFGHFSLKLSYSIFCSRYILKTFIFYHCQSYGRETFALFHYLTIMLVCKLFISTAITLFCAINLFNVAIRDANQRKRTTGSFIHREKYHEFQAKVTQQRTMIILHYVGMWGNKDI